MSTALTMTARQAFPRGRHDPRKRRTPSVDGDGRDLGRVRDLADDLDDVAVRVEDAELPVGAVAAREDVAHAFELTLCTELPRVRLDVPERPADELGDGDAVPAARGEIHHGRLEAVPRREPLVLGRQGPVVRRDRLASL